MEQHAKSRRLSFTGGCIQHWPYNLRHFEISSATGGGGGLFGPDPENKVMVNGLIWNLVPIMVPMILVNRQHFKHFYFQRYDVTKIPLPEWNESSLFDIYPLKSSKTREKWLFMPENIFPGTNLCLPLHFYGSEAKQRNSYVQFFETSHFKNNCSNPLVNRFC